MRRICLAASIALCACGSIVRAPNPIPASGVVECTDSMDVPTLEAIVGVVAPGAVAVGLSDRGAAIDHGGVLWVPVAGLASIAMLFGAAESYATVAECREAKQRGARQIEVATRKAAARTEAQALWKRAVAASRADDCATVRELAPQVRELDVEFHAVVFKRDVGIARCLAVR